MRGGEFREARLRAGLSIRYTAQQVGVSPSTVVRWEATDADVTSTAADWIRGQAGARPDLHTISYALGRVLRCCAEVWEQTGESLPDELAQGFPVRPADHLGPLLARARARSPRHYALVEDEIEAHLRRIPPDGVPEQLAVQDEGAIWLGYYHRGADRRAIEEAGRDDLDG